MKKFVLGGVTSKNKKNGKNFKSNSKNRYQKTLLNRKFKNQDQI